MNLGAHFNRVRVARSLVTVIALSLLTSIGLTPNFLPIASAAIVTTGTCSVDGTNMSTSNIIDSSTVDGTCIVRLTSGTSSFLVPTGINTVAALAVGGGGGGGFGGNGGGGGAGAVIVSDTGVTATPGSTISGTVGESGTSGYQSPYTKGGKGTNTSVTINSSTFVASGGGGGSSFNTAADDGGSGGGKAVDGTGPGSGYNLNYSNWSEYVNNGATHSGGNGGGGGGAGGVASGSNGGIGRTIWGYSVGGGGSGWGGGNAAVAAPFGGGAPRVGEQSDAIGGCSNNSVSCNGRANTGGGGGGGGAGGSGVIAIKFVPSRGQGTIAQSNGFQVNRSATFTFTRTGTVPTSTSATYQWQVKPAGSSTWSNVTGGTGGTTLTYQTPTLGSSDNGNTYRIAVTDTQATYGISTTTFTEVSAQSLFTPPGGETDTAVNTSANRFFYAPNANSILPGTLSTLTMEAWIKPSATCDGNYYCSVFASNNSVFLSIYQGNIAYIIGSGAAWCSGGVVTQVSRVVPSGSWTHIAMVRSSSNVKIYINGGLVSDLNSSCSPTSMTAPSSQQFGIGYRHTLNQYFYGSIDEARIWTSDRSASIASDMHSNETSTANLIGYWNFNEGSGEVVYNQVPTAQSSSDLISDGTDKSNPAFWDSASISDETRTSAYSIRTFYRTYITANNGWKVPSGVSRVSALVVGGGGGAGFNSGGGGSGGGVSFQGSLSLSGINTVKIGAGGLGSAVNGTANSGQSSIFGATTTSGGNGGVGPEGAGGASVSGSGAGGAGSTSNSTPGGNGGNGPSYSISGASVNYAGGGGGGGWITNTVGGTGGTGGGGAGGGGGASSRTGANNNNGASGIPNTGGGGGAGSVSSSTSGNGGSGIVIIRWITASVPTYTKPTNAFLNVGMTETFTTNVAVDSATVGLTRTFTWESSTVGAAGPFTRIKSGTGAANAAFSWVPSDTSTSGSNYLYRLTVTDSDTAGLFITDSSTAFAVINPALRVSGLSSIPKVINLSKSETFTITLGTSTYRTTLSPVIPGITLDTSTAGSPVIRISDTMTVGTYYETLTVVDSVSALVVLPLVIRVLAPPQLTNTGEIVADGQVFNLDFSNSASYSPLSQAIADISGAKKTITAPNGGTYSNDFSGIYTLSSASKQYLTATAFSMLPKWTIETYIRINQTPTPQFCPFASEYASSSISMLLCVDAARTVFTGFFDRIGGVDKWSFKRSQEVIPLNTWVHIVGTFDGSAANLYFDGVSTTRNSVDGGRYDAGYVPPTPNTNRVFIGKDYPTTVGTTPDISLGFVRAFSSGLTQTQIQQNFNATRTRFETVNQSQLKPNQKYGSLTLESFTATSGSDTKTVTFAVGNRTGVTWDTSTAGRVNLSVQESLTVGTYYDTVTVTDNLGQSTYLPLSFTVTKADTITVTMNSPSALNYTGSMASFIPTLSITGLKNSDTATASSVTITQTRAGNTCAMGGTCAIGDRGPGGGIVFITPSTVSGNGRFFEAAPDAWYGANDLSTVGKFCTAASNRDNTNEGATQFGIGWGETNTAIFRVNCTGGAVKLATDYRGGGFSNWFVPSKNELAEMAKIPTTVDLINVTNYWGYWSSTEKSGATASTMDALTSSSWTMGAVSKSESTRNMVRPVRMFTACHSVDSCTAYSSTTMPTNAGTYRLTPSALTLSSGDLANYQGVSYASGLLTINKVNQVPIKIGQYDAFPGISTYPLNVYGGAGTGVMRRTLTSAGTASCVLTNLMFITAATPGKCEVRVTKAADFNYLAETATATIYWIQFVDRYTNSGPTSPTDLGLSGGTAMEKRTYETFTVLSFADETGTAVTSIKANTKLRVIGTGFVSTDTGTEVYFGIASVPHAGLTFNTLDPMANYVLLTVPADAETDRVLMYSTGKRWATRSPGTLTILP